MQHANKQVQNATLILLFRWDLLVESLVRVVSLDLEKHCSPFSAKDLIETRLN